MTALSVIVPVLDEADGIVTALKALAPLRARGAEVVVADGGSTDATVSHAWAGADGVVVAPRGRAAQMNAGAAVARGDALLFLHVDTQLPAEADWLVAKALQTHPWGRFDVSIDGRSWLLPLIAAMMNRRSRLTGIATGDQAMFVRRAAFLAAGGFPDLPLMEDIALSARLKRIGRPACLPDKVVTSGRRWDRHGALRTMLLMWRLRLAYALGADPTDLARRYGYRPREAA